MSEVATDFKNPPRIKDPELMKRLWARRGVCVLCGNPASIHHIYARGQQGDDVVENLIWLCGDGVTGHHGLIEAMDVVTRIELGEYIKKNRPSTILYMQLKLGNEEGLEWLRQRFFMVLP